MNFKEYRKFRAFSGYYKNDDLLLSCASGGAISAISEAFIKKHGVVFGVIYTRDFRGAEYAIARTAEELEQFKQSKYISASKVIEDGNGKKSVFDFVRHELDKQNQVLFVGLGCDIAALKKYCENKSVDDRNLFTIELICHGPGIQKVHEAYIDYIEEQHNSKLISFTTRFKKEGALPPYVKAEFENGESFIQKFGDTDLGKAFYRYAKPGCTKCPFKAMNHQGDVVIGDHLGISDVKLKNRYGDSLIVVQNQKGDKLINDINEDDFYMVEVDTAYAIKCNSMFWTTREQASDYDSFIKNLAEKGLHEAIKCVPPAEKKKTKKNLKSIIKGIVPQQIVTFVRKKFDIV